VCFDKNKLEVNLKMKNNKSKIAKRVVGFTLILAGLALAIIATAVSNVILGVVGLAIIKIGGWVIKISLIIKIVKKIVSLFKRKRNQAVVEDVTITENDSFVEVLQPEIIKPKAPSVNCTNCSAIIGAGALCAFCGAALEQLNSY